MSRIGFIGTGHIAAPMARFLSAKGHDIAVTERNVKEALAMRDLMADLRSADPFRQGGGKGFTKADRSRFLDALERALRAAKSA